jgi:biopolymer transport protein ExbD
VRPLPTGDDTAMNLTPMIDLVFNLVAFFLLATDLSHKDFLDVALPRAASGAEDVPGRDDRRIVASVTSDGRVHLRGRTYAVFTGDPVADARSVAALGTALRTAVADRLREGEDAPAVLVRGDRDALWRHVQRLMQACAAERIHRIQFAVSARPADLREGE